MRRRHLLAALPVLLWLGAPARADDLLKLAPAGRTRIVGRGSDVPDFAVRSLAAPLRPDQITTLVQKQRAGQ